MPTSIADLFVSVTSDVSGAISGLTQVDQRVNGTSAAMAAAVPSGYALAGAAAAVGAAFLTSINQAADFEHQINGIRSVMSPAEVVEFGGAVRDLALVLGRDTVFTSAQAADAIQELIRAGVPLEAILAGGARSALDLASATGANVVDAAGLAASAMSAFHLSADRLPGVMDTISNVSNATRTSVSGLAQGLSDTGVTAYQFGLTFEDTALAIGVFAQNGLTANTAGTALRTMLVGLTPTTAAQTAMFRELGLTTEEGGNRFFDASGRVRSMSEVAGILQTALANLNPVQRATTLEVLFGRDGMQAASIAAGEGAAGFDRYAAAADRMGGTAVAAATRNAGLTGSMNQLGGSFEAIQIQIGTLFLPLLTRLVDGLTALLNGFLTLDPGIQTAIVAVVGIAGAAAGLLAGFILLGPVLGALGAAFGIIAGAVASVSLPILALVAAGALLWAAWQDDFGGIQEVTAQVWEAIQPAFVNIVAFIGTIRDTLAPMFADAQSSAGPFIEQMSQALAPILAQLPGLVRQAGDQFNQMGVFLGQVADAVRFLVGGDFGAFYRLLLDDSVPIGFVQALTQMHAAFEVIGPVVEMVAQALNFLITGNMDRLVELMQEGLPQPFAAGLQLLHDIIAGQIQVWGDLIGGIVSFIGYLLHGDIQGAFNSLIATFGRIRDDILPIWNEFLQVVGNLLQGLGPWVAEHVPGMWNALLAEFAQLPGQLAPYWDAFAGWLGSVLAGVPGFIGEMAGDVWGALRTAFEGLVDMLAPSWDAFAGWLGAVLGGIPQFVGDMAGDVWAALRAAFDGLVDMLAPAWDVFAGWLGAVLGGVPQFVGDNLGDVFSALGTAFNGLVDMLAPAWDTFAGWLGAVVGGIGQFVADNVGDIWGGLTAAFFGLVDALAPAWDAFAGWLGNVLAGLPQFVADHIGDVWGALIAAFTGSTPGTTTTTPDGGGGNGTLGDGLVSGILVQGFQALVGETQGTNSLLTSMDQILIQGFQALAGQPQIGGGGTGSSGSSGPLVSIGTLIVSNEAERESFLQQMSDAILASARRVTPPLPGITPVLG